MAENLNNGSTTSYQPPSPAALNPSPHAEPAASSAASPTAGAEKPHLSDLKDRATEDLQELKHAAKDQAQQALEKTSEMAAEQKNFIATQLGAVATALEKVGGELNQGDEKTVGRYAQDLGGSAKRLAADLKDRDMREIASMAEDFGRKQPLAFLGLAALAGLAASRFVTASAARHPTVQKPATPNSDRNAFTGNMGDRSNV